MEETSEQESVTSESCYESESDDEYDSKEDPTFEEEEEEEEEETRFNLSNLSIKKKTKDCSGKGTGEGETVKLDDQELKSYETILKMIQGCQVEKLKVDQCKIYLRKHGLRLGGIKQTLIHRIKEHVNIVNGGGEEKYPASSFVLNCKGDACTGDVVIFEQNVYEMFNIASRSGNGLCGTRVVAGRIVKESYGAAKQQHTFTIEVLWSKGEKPLPPLHPLLIKGRNLYRLKTMRQKWEDEGERHRILSEKHARGGVARLSREARLQQKQMWKSNKPNRTTRKETSQRQKEEIRETLYPVSSKPEVLINQPKQKQQDSRNGQGEQYCKQKIDGYKRTCELNISKQPEYMHQNPNTIINPHGAPECFYQRQPLISASFPRGPKSDSSGNLTRGFSHDERHMTNNTPKSPNQGHSMGYCSNSNEIKTTFQSHTLKENRGGILGRSPSRGFGYNHIPSQYQMNFISPVYGYHGRDDNFGAARNSPVQGKGYVQNQTCRYYAQGRCYYGDRCKYLHEVAGHKP